MCYNYYIFNLLGGNVMIIRNKSDSLHHIEKMGLNCFPEKVFNPRDEKMLEKINLFLEENDVERYVLRDVSKCQGRTFFNISKNEVYQSINSYDDKFSIAVSSKNYGNYVLIGDIYISDTLENFWLLASDNPNYNTRGVLKDPKWNISTHFFDERIKYVPNIDKIIDYIFEHNLFNVVIEFAVYPKRVGKKNEFVAIFELRTHY